MKARVHVYGCRKKTLCVSYILAHKVSTGMYFIEIDFCGDSRPYYFGSGESELFFMPQVARTDEKLASIAVMLTLPRRFGRCHIYGQIHKRTWRGYIMQTKLLDPAYASKRKQIWRDGSQKPIYHKGGSK